MRKNVHFVSESFEIKQSKKQPVGNTGKTKNEYEYASYLNTGFYLVTPLLVCVFLGNFVDGHYKTAPVGVLTGIILGTAGTFYNLIRLTKR